MREGGLQQSREAEVQEPERREQGKQQDHNPGVQKNNIWPIQGPAYRNPMGGGHGEQKNQMIFKDHFIQVQEPHEQEIKQKWQEVCMGE